MNRAEPLEAGRLALLPWEDAEAFAELHAAFCREHAPEGPTETSLVDRLAWTEWRRHRLLLGERAAHLAGLQEKVSDEHRARTTLRRALLGSESEAERDELKEALTKSVAAEAEDLADADDDEGYTQRAIAVLEAGGSYEDGLAALRQDTVGWWSRLLAEMDEGAADDEGADDDEEPPDENGPYLPTAPSLLNFLKDEVLTIFPFTRERASRRPAIRLQAWGESVDPFRLDQLFALDERLTRQFEKVLAMLVRLKELRARNRPPART